VLRREIKERASYLVDEGKSCLPAVREETAAPTLKKTKAAENKRGTTIVWHRRGIQNN